MSWTSSTLRFGRRFTGQRIANDVREDASAGGKPHAAVTRQARAIGIVALVVLLSACQRAEASGCTCTVPIADAPPVGIASPSVGRATVFLVDRAFTPAPPREASYAPSQLTTRARSTIAALLKDPGFEVAPNDVLFGATISSHSTRPEEVFLPIQAAPRLTEPDLRSHLVRPVPEGPLECHGYCDRVMTYNQAVSAEAVGLADSVKAYVAARDDALRAFTSGLVRQLESASFATDVAGTDIWGGLYGAAAVLSRARSAGVGDLRLLVFSDMVDTVGHVVPIDLSDVSVIVALYRRDAIQDDAAGKVEWERRLRLTGAKRVEFIPWSATSVSTIAGALGRH